MTSRHRDVLRLAVAAECDPRTALRWLRGEAVRPRMEARLAGAAAKLGLRRTAVQKGTKKKKGGRMESSPAALTRSAAANKPS
jgi:hypothetical protein